MEDLDKSVEQEAITKPADQVPDNDDSRAKLIQTAISFLQNPKVRGSPLSQKKSFLESKGLLPDEVKLALEQSGSLSETGTVGNALPQHSYSHLAQNAYVGHPYPAVVSISRFSKFREFCTVVLVTGGTLYGIYQFIKKYIIPYMYGLPTEEERLENLEKQMTSFQVNINETLAQLQNTLRDLQNTLQQICRKQDTAAQSQIPSNLDSQFKDLRAEITSLKGLLLNKHQFPAAPTMNRIIPSWQMDKPESSTLSNGSESEQPIRDNDDEDNGVSSA